MANKQKAAFTFSFTPKGEAQKLAKDLWHRSRIMFMLGIPGSGKSFISLALALSDVLKSDTKKLILTRPQITVKEPMGYMPGNLEEKFSVWLGPIKDVFSSMSQDAEWEKLVKVLANRLELIPLGMMRGRTIRNAVCVAEEMQNADYAQLKCLLTRLGENGRIILNGDIEQSDRFTANNSPLADVADRLIDIDTISLVTFEKKDQNRDPLVNDILSRLQ